MKKKSGSNEKDRRWLEQSGRVEPPSMDLQQNPGLAAAFMAAAMPFELPYHEMTHALQSGPDVLASMNIVLDKPHATKNPSKPKLK